MSNKKMYLLCIVIFCFVSSSSIYAKDQNLDFNTDELKNKQDDYSSLTDMNGLHLFTTETQTVISKNLNQQAKMYKEKKENLFHHHIVKQQEKEIAIFLSPISFDKTMQNKTHDFPIQTVLSVFTVGLGGCVFVMTRKYYKQRRETNNEIDFNVDN